MYPYLNREVKAAFRWYDRPELRTRNRIACKAESELCPFALHAPNHEILPFQFVAGIGQAASENVPTKWRLMSLSGTTVLNLTTYLTELQVDHFVNPTRSYITLEETMEISSGLGTGLYEMEIDTPGGTYYSETFRVCGDLEELERCHVALKWKSCGDVGTLHYGVSRFENLVYLEASPGGASIVRPTPEFNDDREDTDEKTEVVTGDRKDVRWTLEAVNIPWFLMDALTEVPLHDTISLKAPGADGYDTLLNVTAETEWPNGVCLGNVNLLFSVDDGTLKGACCNSFDVPCPTSCGEADGVWNIGDDSPETTGTVWLLTNSRFGTFYGIGHELARDAYGFGNFVWCPERLATVDGEDTPYVYLPGAGEWTKAIEILEVTVEDCDAGIVNVQGFALAPFSILIQHSEDEVTWVDAGAAVQTIGGGVDVEIPSTSQYIRARLLGYNDCIVGTSSVVENPCGCQPGLMVTSGSVTALFVEVGEEAGRPAYARVGYEDTWEEPDAPWIMVWAGGTNWQIKGADGIGIYYSTDDVATPDLVTTWAAFSGLDPLPVIDVITCE